MRRKSPFWLIALVVLGLLAILPLLRAQTAARKGQASPPKKAAPAVPRTNNAAGGQVASSAAETPSPLPADLEVKRLILKDGSFQPIRNYEMRGGRVRYYSSERFEWEEIPSELIDWAATEKYARAGGAAKNTEVARELDAEEQAERKREQEMSPEVAAGLRLPFQGGVFLLDTYNQQPQLDELVQNTGEIKKNMGKNVLRAAINPVASAKQTIELKGAHATVQAHVANPMLFVNVDADHDDTKGGNGAPGQASRFVIVKAESDAKKNMRVVGNLKIAIYGKVSQEKKAVPATVETYSGPWLKITPSEPLAPGEYAVVELLKGDQMNLYVWDFGVNPQAPANGGAWRPAPAKAAGSAAPVLQNSR